MTLFWWKEVLLGILNNDYLSNDFSIIIAMFVVCRMAMIFSLLQLFGNINGWNVLCELRFIYIKPIIYFFNFEVLKIKPMPCSHLFSEANLHHCYLTASEKISGQKLPVNRYSKNCQTVWERQAYFTLSKEQTARGTKKKT